MKYKKLKIISVVCMLSLLISQGNIVVSSVYGDDSNPSSVYTETNKTGINPLDFIKNINIEKVYDGNTSANDVNLKISETDDVWLKADAEYKDCNAGENKAVILSEIGLYGNDISNYELVDLNGNKLEDNNLELYIGTITKKIITLEPIDKNKVYYSNEQFPISVSVNNAYNQIVNDDKVSDLPSDIYIIKNENGEYLYSLKENFYSIEQASEDNKNYIFTIDENCKPNISVKPELQEAEFEISENTEDTKLYYDKELGFIINKNVNVVLRASPVIPDDDSLIFYTKINNAEGEEVVQGPYIGSNATNKDIYKVNISFEVKEGECYKKISCSLDEGKTYQPIEFKNGENIGGLIIDKKAPIYKELKLKFNDEIQMVGVSGTFNDDTGISKVEYKLGEDTDYKEIYNISNDEKISGDYVFKNEGQDGNEDEDVYYIASYSQIKKNDEVDKVKVTFKVTDVVGNENEITVEPTDEPNLAKPVIKSIELQEDKGKTKLDELLNVLSFGIYTNKKLILNVKAVPADFDVKDKNVTVTLIDQSEDKDKDKYIIAGPISNEGNTENTFKFELKYDSDNEKNKIIEELCVKVENGYGQSVITSLREALQTIPDNESAQWKNMPNTNADKWIFDKAPPSIKVSLENVQPNEETNNLKIYDIHKNKSDDPKDSFSISVNDDNGISSLKIYNKNDTTYSINDVGSNTYQFIDDENKEYELVGKTNDVFSISDNEKVIRYVTIVTKTETDVSQDGQKTEVENTSYIIEDKEESGKIYYLFNIKDKEKNKYSIVAMSDNNGYTISCDNITTTVNISETHKYYNIYDDNNKGIDKSDLAKNCYTKLHCDVNTFDNQLNCGKNDFVVIAIDNALNITEKDFSVNVIKDINKDKLELSIDHPSTTDNGKCWIDGKCWINESKILNYNAENTEETQYLMKFKFKGLSNQINLTDISSIRFKINDLYVSKTGNNLEADYNTNDTNLKDLYKNEDNGLEFGITKEEYEQIQKSNDYIDNNLIKVNVEIEDTSYWNQRTVSVDYEFHIDKKNPQIEEIKVKDQSSTEKFVNVLSFGIFHNDNLTLCVHAVDGKNDIGIDSVEIKFNDINKTADSKEESDDTAYPMEKSPDCDNCYTYTIEKSKNEVINKTFNICVKDKFGKSTEQLSNVSNMDGKDGFNTNSIMIETNDPVVNLEFGGDYHSSEGNIWVKGGKFDKNNPIENHNITLSVEDRDSGVKNISAELKAENGQKTVEFTKEDSFGNGFQCSDYNKESPVKINNNYKFSVDDLSEKVGNVDGMYTLSVNVTDNAGNSKNVEKSFYRDITAPEITKFEFKEQSENGKKETDEMNTLSIDQESNIVQTYYGYYFKKDFELTVCAKDENASSGLNEVTLTRVNYENKTIESETKQCTYNSNQEVEFPTFTIEAGFKGMITASITDNSGNVSDTKTPRAFVSDNNNPIIIIKANNEPIANVKDFNDNSIYEDIVSFTVTVTDEKSGLKKITYKSASDNSYYNNEEVTEIDDSGSKKAGEEVGNGWKILSTDLNVVTSVEKTFTYGELKDEFDDFIDDTGIYASFTAEDNSNNSDNKQTNKFTIDRKSPTINNMTFTSFDGLVNVDFVKNHDFEYRYFFKYPFTVSTKISDPVPSSGLNKTYFKFVVYDKDHTEISKFGLTKNFEKNVVETGGIENVNIPEDFTKGQILVKAYDNTLKNVSEEIGTYGVVVDNTSPKITIDKLPNTNDKNNAVDDEGNILYNDPKKVYFTVTVEDPDSGIKVINYTKTSEKTVGTKEVNTLIDMSNPKYAVNGTVGNAKNNSDWVILSMDHNLVTKVSRTFVFDKDDKNIRFSFNAVDRSENMSETSKSQSFTIDTVKPSVTGVSFSRKTADNISKVEPDEFIEKLEYGYYFKEETKITASCKDNRPSSGLKMMKFRFVPYKDGKQIEQSKYNEPKNINVTDIVKTEKVVNGKATCTVEKGFKGQIFITVYDYAAQSYDVNMSDEITTNAYVIEDNAPEISIVEFPDTSLTDDLGNNLYNGTVKFKVTITDKESGLREISYTNHSDNIKGNEEAQRTVSQKIDNVSDDYAIDYSFENTGWKIDMMDNNLVTQVSRIFVFDKDDKNIYMTFGATDRSNNVSDSKNSPKFTIDTVSPTIEKFNFEPSSEDNISEVTDFIEELEYGYYFKKSFNAVVTVDDKIPSSGCDKVIFRLVSYDNGELVSEHSYPVTVQGKKASYIIPEGFKGQIYAQVFDRSVNKSLEETPQAFVVDETAPTVTVEPLPDNKTKTDMDGNKLYTDSVRFKVTVTDDKSGLRSVIYSKSSEKDSYNDVITQVQNITGHNVGDTIDNGWQITKMDKNLITEVSQIFTFSDDDNRIVMNYRATDRSMNTCNTVQSESFTIDTTAPVVHIDYPEPVNGKYYKGSVTFNFSITERNFDPALLISEITDSYKGNNLRVSYRSSGSTEHTGTITFPEGDYKFTYQGEDRGGNKIQIFDNKNTVPISVFTDSFNVDNTDPKVTTNFDDFVVEGKDEYYFNTNKTIKIAVIEHNFYAYDMEVSIEKKMPGSGHTNDGDDWYEIGAYSEKWKQDASNADRHTLDIELKDDSIYRVTVKPTDRAGNYSAVIKSPIFEIDKTVPRLEKRNDISSDKEGFVETPFLDVYDEKRKDDPAPSVMFDDNNFDRLVIKAAVYKPKYINDNQIINIEKDAVSNELSKTIYEKNFDLNKYFKDDGVYIFSFVAYDKAGNASKEINDTYFKMVSTDILAYIANSDQEEQTGYYSLMDENQKALSKKASDFSDLDIGIITKNENKNDYDVQVRDEKNQYSTKEYATIADEKISKTSVIKTIHLPGYYFSETFKDDSLDARMYLSVYYKDIPYDLATIHIDNEKPSAVLPDYFHSWSNMMFTDEVEVTLSNVSEKLDMDKTKIYECSRDGKREEIKLSNGSYNESQKTLTFTLSEGIHNIDICLVDEAGNEWNIDRIRYFTVGNFWLYVSIGVVLFIAAVVITIVLIKKHKKSKKNVHQT